MYEIKSCEGGFIIYINNKPIFRHSIVHPMMIVGYSKLSFKSTHGAFTVKEKTTSDPIGLTKYTINEDGVTLSAKDLSVKLIIENTDYGAKITCETDSECDYYRFDTLSAPKECIFGGGEQYRKLNLKGEYVENFVSEHINPIHVAQKTILGKVVKYREKKHKDIKTYAPMSTFVSSEHYAIRFDVDSHGLQDFRPDYYSSYKYYQLPKSIKIFTADSYKDITKAMATDIPNREYLPDWVHEGMILGVQNGIYRTIAKAKKMINKGAKVCGVWNQDWSGKKITAVGSQVYWNWEVDHELYPNLQEKIAELKEMGVHFLAYINPYLIVNGKMYNHCKKMGYLIKNPKGEVYHIKSTTFDAGMMDLTNPHMVKYLKEVIIKQNMLDLGIDGYMADFGEYLPVDSVLYRGNAIDLHNMWPTMWAKINREAVEESGRAEEIFFFTRSAYNQSQEYTTMMWNGDQHTDFTADYGMPCVMPATFNLGFSGVTAVHSDIGGYISFYTLKRTPEVYVRWMEMSTFSPLLRSHETIRPQVNAQYDSNGVLEHACKLSSIHAHIAPYIKVTMAEANLGIMAMRPAFYEENDLQAHKTDYEYLFGADIFVSPVMAYDVKQKTVNLPKGNWIHIFTGEKFAGNQQITVHAPLGTPPVFYREGSEYEELFAEVKNI
ncbi:MAG: alpha-glucosidase [Bacillota bacterium]